MVEVTVADLCRWTGGSPVHLDTNTKIGSVGTDSRKISGGMLFIALKGERFDGHDFLKKAVLNGAAAVMSEKECGTLPAILVKDTQAALLDMARGYRAIFDIPFVGISGSVGKTTTKETVYNVLSQKYNTLKTIGNFNNEIGLPLTILNLSHEHQCGVIEMGMSHFGEISRLTSVVQPNVAVLTNIGMSHIENLGSQEGILKAKLEIIEGLAPDGTLVVNGDDPYLWGCRNTLSCRVLTYGVENKNCDFIAEDIDYQFDSISFTIITPDSSYPAVMNAVGAHNVYNGLAAAVCGRLLGISDTDTAAGLAERQETKMRLNVVDCDGFSMIEDCYNSSPDSMLAALQVLMKAGGTRKIAVLADMLEMGEHSKSAHSKVGKAVAVQDVDSLITFGEMGKVIALSAVENGMNPQKVHSFSEKESIYDLLEHFIQKGDVVLVKGSRGMKMETVCQRLKDLKIEQKQKME